VLTFDEKSHSYFWKGVRVPGVTSILQPVQDYSMVNADVLLAAQQRGTAVHRMTELYDQDDLDEDFLELGMLPYLKAWKNFRANSGFVPDSIEQRMYHPGLKYCGTPDRAGLIDRRRAVLDIKSMFTPGSPVIGLQLAAYKELYNVNTMGGKIEDRYALHLRHDGTYRLFPYTDPTDWTVFVSLLNLMNWKAKNGIQ
jgi:hypothetical protein